MFGCWKPLFPSLWSGDGKPLNFGEILIRREYDPTNTIVDKHAEESDTQDVDSDGTIKRIEFNGFLDPTMRQMFRKYDRDEAETKELLRYCNGMKSFRRFSDIIQVSQHLLLNTNEIRRNYLKLRDMKSGILARLSSNRLIFLKTSSSFSVPNSLL